MKSLFYELKNVLRSPIFWIAVVLNALFIFFNGDFLLATGRLRFDICNHLQIAYWPGLAAFVAPILSALPYVTKFHEEKTSGIYRIKVLRYGKLSYVVHHILMAMITGFLVIVVSIALYDVFICFLALICQQPVVIRGIENAFGDASNPSFYYNLAASGKIWLVYVIHVLFLGGYGMIWSGIGVIFSIFVKNRNFAIVFPLFVKRLMECLPEEMIILTPNFFRFEGIEGLPCGGLFYAVSYLLAIVVVGTFCLSMGLNIHLKRNG